MVSNDNTLQKFKKLFPSSFENNVANQDDGITNNDSCGYNLRPDGNKTWIFENFENIPNLVSHYTEWTMMVQKVGTYFCGTHEIQYVLKKCLGVFHCPEKHCNYY
jgi:hypothetical protein